MYNECGPTMREEIQRLCGTPPPRFRSIDPRTDAWPEVSPPFSLGEKSRTRLYSYDGAPGVFTRHLRGLAEAGAEFLLCEGGTRSIILCTRPMSGLDAPGRKPSCALSPYLMGEVARSLALLLPVTLFVSPRWGEVTGTLLPVGRKDATYPRKKSRPAK